MSTMQNFLAHQEILQYIVTPYTPAEKVHAQVCPVVNLELIRKWRDFLHVGDLRRLNQWSTAGPVN